MRRLALLCLALLSLSARAEPVRVAVLMHVVAGSADGTAAMRAALDHAQVREPAFIVANGLRHRAEPCRDSLFRDRKAVLEAARVPVVLSMAGGDWLDCRDRQGRPAPMIWLNLLRDQLYGNISWHGSKSLTLKRQSAIPAFRSYAENTRWAWRRLLFATLHLPAGNNHYVRAAGGNSEFEDRLTANRYWLKRLAAEVQATRPEAVVIFSDGRVFPPPANGEGRRDGFAEIRRAIESFAARANLPVLLVQGGSPDGSSRLQHSGRLTYASLPAGVSFIDIDAASATPFELLGPVDSIATTEP